LCIVYAIAPRVTAVELTESQDAILRGSSDERFRGGGATGSTMIPVAIFKTHNREEPSMHLIYLFDLADLDEANHQVEAIDVHLNELNALFVKYSRLTPQNRIDSMKAKLREIRATLQKEVPAGGAHYKAVQL
jgi:hypothetical protein